MTTPQKFPPAPPEAFIPLEFDFADFAGKGITIASIKSPLAVTVLNGVDATSADRIYGAASLAGTQSVVQWWRYPVLGEIYEITCTVVLSDAREWSITGRLPCAKV